MRPFTLLICILVLSNPGITFAKNATSLTGQQLYFIENKGQIHDQHGNQRKDIQFAVNGSSINVFIGNGALHYQFCMRDGAQAGNMPYSKQDFTAKIQPSGFNMYRMDVSLVGADTNAEVVAEERQQYYENYFLDGCPVNGIQAHSYGRITYKNVYRNIDWVLLIKDGRLEHEFIVRPGGNVKDIRLKYDGCSSLALNKEGGIEAATPMGIIREQAPVCFSNGRQLKSSFRLQNGIISYNTEVTHGPLLIDPVVAWGTYYGPDSSGSYMYQIVCDDSGNVYSCGYTYATIGNIATTGSYQNTSGGSVDAFLAKFDSSGHRLWGTYFGGPSDEVAYSVAYDKAGHVYMAGWTSSPSGIATPGVYQTTFFGGQTSFLARFNAAGGRDWGTYAGGSGASLNQSVCCDRYGHAYLSGVTSSNSRIGTAGSHMPTMGGGRDCFVIQFDSSGNRKWGTYYGGNDDDFGGVCSSDGYYVYMSGWTLSTSGIASPSSYQPSLASAANSDAFVAKFDTSGTWIWGTYYGGPASEGTGTILCSKGYVYLLGSTSSDTGIATAGAFQTTRGGMTDAFLAKLNPDSGYPVWATYYGGPSDEYTDASRISADNSGNVSISGYTASLSGIASACAWQPAYGGGDNDGFVAKYDSNGVQLWSSYYGGSRSDAAWGCANIGNDVYICGYTNSPDNIATPGGFLPTGGSSASYYQGFIAKIDESLLYSRSDTMICATSDTMHFTLTGPAGSNYRWYNGDTSSTLPINSAGSYWVAYTVGCERAIDTIHITYNTDSAPCNAGVRHLAMSSDISIFPNPASNECTVALPTAITHGGYLYIYDVTGRLMHTYSLNGQHTNISVADLPPGIYQCRIAVSDQVLCRKLVIFR